MRPHRDLLLGAEPAYLVIEAVDVLPHLARNAIADGARVLPHVIDTVHDRVRILGMEREEIENVLRRGLAIEFRKMLLLADDRHQRTPAQLVGLRRLFEQHVIIHVEDARGILRALHIAGDPK